MTRLLTALLGTALAFGLNVASAQNVESDKDKAQGQEQTMQEKEKGAAGAGQQQSQEDRERAKTKDTRSAPDAKDQSAISCKGLKGSAKADCMKNAKAGAGQNDATTGQSQPK